MHVKQITILFSTPSVVAVMVAALGDYFTAVPPATITLRSRRNATD
jgi:hypothetical protein